MNGYLPITVLRLRRKTHPAIFNDRFNPIYTWWLARYKYPPLAQCSTPATLSIFACRRLAHVGWKPVRDAKGKTTDRKSNGSKPYSICLNLYIFQQLATYWIVVILLTSMFGSQQGKFSNSVTSFLSVTRFTEAGATSSCLPTASAAESATAASSASTTATLSFENAHNPDIIISFVLWNRYIVP